MSEGREGRSLRASLVRGQQNVHTPMLGFMAKEGRSKVFRSVIPRGRQR